MHEHPKCLKELFLRRCLQCLRRRLSVLDAREELSSLSELPVFMHRDFHLQTAGMTANRSMTGQPGLDGISLLSPKLYRSDKCCQYIDRMSKSWKTASFYTAQPCHTQSLYSTFNSTASSGLLIPLQICVTEAENTRFSRLDASTDRKSKVN